MSVALELRRTLREVNALSSARRQALLDARQPAQDYLGPHGSTFSFTNAQVRSVVA